MERRGEARKWKQTNPRLFFNIHSIIIKTKENSSNWFELFLSLSLFLSIERKFLSKFTKRRDTWHAISLIRISREKIPSPAWFEPRSDVKTFNDFLGSDPRWDEKRRGKERKREGEREREVARCSIFRINSTTIKGGKRRVHEKRTKKNTPRAK